MIAFETALYAALVAAVGHNRVYRSKAPEGVEFPYVVFFKSSGQASYTHGRRSSRRFLYTVKVVDDGEDQSVAAAADKLIDTALTDGVLDGDALAGGAGTILNARRASDVEYEELEAGITYQHVGGTYRVHIAV